MLKIHVTYGNKDHLLKIKRDNKNDFLLVMTDEVDQGLVLTETPIAESPFKEGNSYEVIDQAGELPLAGYTVLNHIPVTREGRPVFEERFKKSPKLAQNEEGFTAIRFMRPLTNDTYIIMSIWDNEEKFKKWKESSVYKTLYKKEGTSVGLDHKSTYPRESYVRRYTIQN